MYKPNEDKSYTSKLEMEDHIVSLLGGRMAEKLVLDDVSTGASNDIERASKIARAMVMKYGMSDKIGPISFGADQEEVFLGRDINHQKNYSEKVAAEIDEEVMRIVREGYDKAKKILTDHMEELHAVANVLIEKEKIEADEFEAIFNAGKESKKAEKTDKKETKTAKKEKVVETAKKENKEAKKTTDK